MKKITVCLSALIVLGVIGVFFFGCGDDSTPEEEAEVDNGEVIFEEDDPISEEDPISPADQVYSDDSDDPEPVVYSKVTVTTRLDQQVSGEVNLADGASIMIETEPTNGSASVNNTGSWEYTPEPGFVGEDEFSLSFDREDGRTEIKTIQVKVEGSDDEVAEDDEDSDDDTLPGAGGGMALASLISLWLFIAASYSLRKGVFAEQGL